MGLPLANRVLVWLTWFPCKTPDAAQCQPGGTRSTRLQPELEVPKVAREASKGRNSVGDPGVSGREEGESGEVAGGI